MKKQTNKKPKQNGAVSRSADMIMAALCCSRWPVVLQLKGKPFYCVVSQHQHMCLQSLYYLSLISCQHVRVETIEGLPQRRVGKGCSF